MNQFTQLEVSGFEIIRTRLGGRLESPTNNNNQTSGVAVDQADRPPDAIIMLPSDFQPICGDSWLLSVDLKLSNL